MQTVQGEIFSKVWRGWCEAKATNLDKKVACLISSRSKSLTNEKKKKWISINLWGRFRCCCCCCGKKKIRNKRNLQLDGITRKAVGEYIHVINKVWKFFKKIRMKSFFSFFRTIDKKVTLGYWHPIVPDLQKIHLSGSRKIALNHSSEIFDTDSFEDRRQKKCRHFETEI